MCVDLAQ